MLKSFLLALFPFRFALLLFFFGLLFLFVRKERLAKRVLVVSFCILFLGSLSGFSGRLLFNLESRYPSFDVLIQKENLENIMYIVVLGDGHVEEVSWPLTSQLSDEMLKRTVEGMRLHLQLPHTKIVVSGGKLTKKSEAEVMQELLVSLGISADDIITERKSANTYEQALFLKPILRQQRFILVTSARHMPRAMKLFQEHGLQPLAAPTAHYVLSTKSFIPSLRHFQKLEIALYEYLGLIKNAFLQRTEHESSN